MPELEALFPGLSWMVAAVFGACFGSFANMAIFRLPQEIGLARKPSHCPKCKKQLKFKHLIPILSYLVQRGKCGMCGWKIPPRYLWVELASVALFLGVAFFHGFGLHAWLVALVGITLLILTVIDWDHFYIPDELQLVLALLGVFLILETERPWVEPIMLSLGGVGLALLLRALMQWWKGREGLGLGDVKFFGVTGLYLSGALVAPFLFLAGMGGILTAIIGTRTKDSIFPFGPALALALFLCVAAPDPIMNYFTQFIDFLVEFTLQTADNRQ